MNHSTQHTSSNRNTQRAFTIVEMLVTIGILVVVTAGVATIFTSIGNTVTKGRKVSELNQFAARLERVMRDDFESMTRDGFLVIVNKNANGGNDVPLFRGERTNIDADLYGNFSDEPGRIRRSDEIMFFSRGDFESSRPAISNGMIPRSHEAAVYYGHGQKRRPQTATSDPNFNDPNNLFFNPAPWDTNYDNALDTRVGFNTPGLINPNEFARDWSLLRHVTLLVNPNGNGQQVPETLFGLDRSNTLDRQFLEDSARQIALQPAARSIFTSLCGSDGYGERWLYDAANNGPATIDPRPHYRVSGLVDVVTEDLATIRGMIQALPVKRDPSAYFNYVPNHAQPINVDRDTFEFQFWNDSSPTFPNPGDALAFNVGETTNTIGNIWSVGDQPQLTRMRKWMIDALPSRWDLRTDFPRFVSGVRYEDIPTRLLFEEDEFSGSNQDDILKAYAEANQEMLGASVFVPRCTEFIVEWSYGFMDHNNAIGTPNFKRMLWYGLNRVVDRNNDGVLNQDDANQIDLAARTYSERSGNEAGRDYSQTPEIRRSHGMKPEQVVGRSFDILPAAYTPDLVEIATFGYITNGNPAVAKDTTWVWPKFIRITMSLGDPNDKQLEQTYQIIFELPKIDE